MFAVTSFQDLLLLFSFLVVVDVVVVVVDSGVDFS